MLPTYNLLSLWSITGADPCVILLHLIALEKQRQILGHTKFLHPWKNETNRSRDTDSDVHIVGAFWKTSQKLRCRLNVPSATRSRFPLIALWESQSPDLQLLINWLCCRKELFISIRKGKWRVITKLRWVNTFFFDDDDSLLGLFEVS